MIKININDTYINSVLKDNDLRLSNIQNILLIISTIMTSFTIYFHTYVDIISVIVIGILVVLMGFVYVYLELMRNDYKDVWTVKEIKVKLSKKDKKLYNLYKIKFDGYRGSVLIPYDEYKELNSCSIGYGVVIKNRSKVILWFSDDKFIY